MQNVSKEVEKEHLNKLIDDHWDYIECVLLRSNPYISDIQMDEVRFHYKTSGRHFWGHCREFHLGETL